MKIPPWFSSVWEMRPLKILWKLNVSPGNSELKSIPHNLGCNSMGLRVHWWIPACPVSPQWLSVLTYIANPLFSNSHFAALPLFTDSLPRKAGVSSCSPPSSSLKARWSLDLRSQPGVTKARAVILWVSALGRERAECFTCHAPHPQHGWELSEGNSVHPCAPATQRKWRTLSGLKRYRRGDDGPTPLILFKDPRNMDEESHTVSLGSLRMRMALDQAPSFPIHPGSWRGAAFHLPTEKSRLSASLLWDHYRALLTIAFALLYPNR